MRKGIYTFDLLFAILVVLLMFYFATIIITEFRDAISLEAKEFSGQTKAFLISEKLITRDLAISDTQTYQNYIDSGKMNLINTTKYLTDFEISSINVTLLFSNSPNHISEGQFDKTNTYCYTRIVLVSGLISNNPGIIRACIQDK